MKLIVYSAPPVFHNDQFAQKVKFLANLITYFDKLYVLYLLSKIMK